MSNTVESSEPAVQTSLLLSQLLKDRKRERWAKLFRTGILAVALGVFAVAATNLSKSGSPLAVGEYAAMVRLSGEIAPDQDASASLVIPALVKAFQDEQAKGVVMVINSPGGTPVQAALIHDRIVELKREHPNTKFIVVGEDIMASGAYMVAVAGDRIYLNPSTIAGSIGVISRGFGFTQVMATVGVENRTLTSGTSKNRMDPFLPVNPDDKAKMETVLGEIHSNFIQIVKEGRKDKLTESDTVLFNGDFWTGTTAIKLGLADKVGDLSSVLKQEFNVTNVKDYTGRKGLIGYVSKGFLSEVRAMLLADPVVLAKPF